MKVLLLTLVLLLCSAQVLSLTCFTCEGDVNCKAETVCPASSQYCKTMEREAIFIWYNDTWIVNSLYIVCRQEKNFVELVRIFAEMMMTSQPAALKTFADPEASL
ncbi:hypothetical protein F7725_020963 [Dissostichus mawsoni]|uniref:Snake toxin/toxin-like domain-containing protein n=1 Tax=Dissostichus mawsoni TaxID=36200 RepID=A0A7J5YES1_DISMA|nr:hypothetical protein F7725_020963 [Dissostichus mawsoni]